MKRSVLPTSGTGWWASGLAWLSVVVCLLLPSMTSWFGPLQERMARYGLPTGSDFVSFEIALALLAVALGVVALRRNDKAWLLLASVVAAVLSGGFWTLFVVGEVLAPH
jgi:hypothetical protein